MDMGNFMAILLITSVATSLLTEAMKKSLDGSNVKYSSNVIAIIMSAVASAIVAAFGIIFGGLPLNSQTILEVIVLFIASWVCAMVGYDKVVQSARQIGGVKDGTKE